MARFRIFATKNAGDAAETTRFTDDRLEIHDTRRSVRRRVSVCHEIQSISDTHLPHATTRLFRVTSQTVRNTATRSPFSKRNASDCLAR